MQLNDILNTHDFFKYACVISIDKLKLGLFYKIFNHYFNEKPICINGNKNPKLKGYQNCTRSHCLCVEYAKRHMWPFVIIFEDDAYPRSNCKEKLEQYILELIKTPLKIDILRLGFCHINGNNRNDFSNSFNKMTCSGYAGSHAEIVFSHVFDLYLNYCKSHDFIADHYLDMTKQVFFTKENLFIQYNKSKSMNNHIGYIADKDYKTPPPGFQPIEEILKNA